MTKILIDREVVERALGVIAYNTLGPLADELRAALQSGDAVSGAGGIQALLALVGEQAENEALWFQADSITEAYFQQELRRLHAAVEAVHLPQASVETVPAWTPLAKQRPQPGALIVKRWLRNGAVWAGIYSASDKDSSFDEWIALPTAATPTKEN